MHMVHAIWAVGLPHIHEPSSTDDAIEHIQSNTEAILDWLIYVAKAILAHKDSPGYQMQKNAKVVRRKRPATASLLQSMRNEPKHGHIDTLSFLRDSGQEEN